MGGVRRVGRAHEAGGVELGGVGGRGGLVEPAGIWVVGGGIFAHRIG